MAVADIPFAKCKRFLLSRRCFETKSRPPQTLTCALSFFLFRPPHADALTQVFWFVTTNDEAGVLDFGATETNKIADFISGAHGAGGKALFSIGGWSDSNFFTKIVRCARALGRPALTDALPDLPRAQMASEDSRASFITNIQTAITADGWDGIDMDW